MKLVFSEARPDYSNYLFPYVVWAFPEPGEEPRQFFERGFLPSSPELDRFYLCRQIRVNLSGFQLSSENRRILRKGAGIRINLVPRADFEITPARRALCLEYSRRRFGTGAQAGQRLDAILAGRVTSHFLVFAEEQTGREIAMATLFLEGSLAYYYNAFYDLESPHASLGMFMMTSAVELFAGKGFARAHLGTCYSRNALYKTQFAGVEFFNGFRWSPDLRELKFLLQRDEQSCGKHLLEDAAFLAGFEPGNLRAIAEGSEFRLPL